MAAMRKKSSPMTPEKREEIGRIIDSGEMTSEEAAAHYEIGFSTATACATAYRRGLKGKLIPKKTKPEIKKPVVAKKTKPQKKPAPRTIGGIRYDAEFKAKAITMVLNGGPPNVRRTHKEVGDELGCSSSGVRKWIVAYDESGSTELDVKTVVSKEQVAHEMAISEPVQPLTRTTRTTDMSHTENLSNANLLQRVAELESELEILKPRLRDYLNL